MTGAELIAAERQRQIEQERWTPEHDAEHPFGVLATAGALYALPGEVRESVILGTSLRKLLWPFDDEWWKPSDENAEERVRELAKAGALIAAEIDKLMREAWRP